ncbi:MAG: type VI secretion system protein TssA [Acidobacteriota bacterium]
MSSAAEAISPATDSIDVEALLVPLAGENPSGESLQYAGLYDEIREARRADENLDQGDWKCELKTADWHQVLRLATDALSGRTKDLQVAAWLGEALVKLRGFAGLMDSLTLMRGLNERFWDTVYPEIDEGDLEARANSLSWMDRQLALAIKDIPLTASTGADHSFVQWEESKQFDIPENPDQLSGAEFERAMELKTRATEEKKTTSEDWRKAKNATRRAFYENLFAVINRCWEEFLALERTVDEKFERQSPALNDLKNTLDPLRTLIEKLVKEKRLIEPDAVIEEEKAADAEPSESGEVSFASSNGAVQSRREALKRLAEVAEFFRRTEPHSPVSYLVQRAIRWGEMPLDVWLRDVIKDESSLERLRETLGLGARSDER